MSNSAELATPPLLRSRFLQASSKRARWWYASIVVLLLFSGLTLVYSGFDLITLIVLIPFFFAFIAVIWIYILNRSWKVLLPMFLSLLIALGVPFLFINIIAGIVLLILGSISAIITFAILVYEKRLGNGEGVGQSMVDEEFGYPLQDVSDLPRRFSYQNLIIATNNFQKKLGRGGSGSVFEGKLVDGTRIAVKRLDQLSQGEREFLAEVMTIGSIHHVSLVRLVGFCAENSRRLLVYEYMSNGSLDKWIFEVTDLEKALKWGIRKKIILCIAKGLAYLHEDCKMRIAHLDVKPQNILLDVAFNAKLSDFGLARRIDRNQSQVMTQMRGTPGYMAPEWRRGRITEKADIYSFGIVILEIVCGRKNLDRSLPQEDHFWLLSLTQKKAEENSLVDLVDKCGDMQQAHHVEEAVEMIRIAIRCLHNDPNRRPSMSTLVKVLEGVMSLEPLNDYGFLTFDAAETPTNVPITSSYRQSESILSGPR